MITQKETGNLSVPDTLEETYQTQLQQIARDSVLEPFEGRKSLETIQKARSKIEKGISKAKEVTVIAKEATGKVKRATVKAGNWLKKSNLVGVSKAKLPELTKEVLIPPAPSRVTELLGKIKPILDNFQESAKSTYQTIEEKARAGAMLYTRKGLELLLYEDTEKWILNRANELLESTDFVFIEQIQSLGAADRTYLTDQLYPYDSPILNKFMKSFETTLNVSLGIVVATNLPGTGIAVSLVNIGKTLIKLGNRLNIMAALYGKQISSPQALFRVSAKILQSLDDWENNKDHVPLDPSVIEELFIPDAQESDAAFKELMSAVVKKEAYIAIPGVGMISLGKINLDDLKMDISVKHLTQNYFARQSAIESQGNEKTDQIINDYRQIYIKLLSHDYFTALRKQHETEQIEQSEKKWQTKLRLIAGLELALKESSLDLDRLVNKIYLTIQSLDEKQREQIIDQEIKTGVRE